MEPSFNSGIGVDVCRPLQWTLVFGLKIDGGTDSIFGVEPGGKDRRLFSAESSGKVLLPAAGS